MAASGLLLPQPGEDVTARDGINEGELGGRHGPNKRGAAPHRDHSDQKRKQKRSTNSGNRSGVLRKIAFTIANRQPPGTNLHVNFLSHSDKHNDYVFIGGAFDIAAGQQQRYEAPKDQAGLWLNSRFTIVINNPYFGEPSVQIYEGSVLQNAADLKVGFSVSHFNIEVLRGLNATDFVNFTVTVS